MLDGSAIIKIRCWNCNKLSPSLRVYFYWKDREKVWQEKTLPDNWEIDEEASFLEDPEAEVCGTCPECTVVSIPCLKAMR